MYHDVQTLTDANANGWAKAWALGDLTGSIIMDINMLDGAGEAMQAARIGAQIAEKGAIDVSEMAGKDAAKTVEECLAGGLSFAATTVVATSRGEQAIGTLKVGDQVWAYNPNTKKMEMQPILHVWINHDNDLVDLTLTPITKHDKAKQPSSEVIHTNQKHPFLTVEKGFVPVGQIKLGMHIVEANGQVGVVSGWRMVPGVKVMYNLEVARDHTFVVGMGMWVVHNCGITGDADPAKMVYPADPNTPGSKDIYQGKQVNIDALNDNIEDATPPNKNLVLWTMDSANSPIGPARGSIIPYLRSQSLSPSNWEYRMETWVKLGESPIPNHYWTDGVNFFHHH